MLLNSFIPVIVWVGGLVLLSLSPHCFEVFTGIVLKVRISFTNKVLFFTSHKSQFHESLDKGRQNQPDIRSRLWLHIKHAKLSWNVLKTLSLVAKNTEIYSCYSEVNNRFGKPKIQLGICLLIWLTLYGCTSFLVLHNLVFCLLLRCKKCHLQFCKNCLALH